jgi:cytochrome c peroxidase
MPARISRALVLGLTVLAAPALPAAALELPPPLSEEDFISFDARQAELGRLLFYDKILSGNQNISCATCHHHDLGGADGLPLGIGEGGEGLGRERTPGYDEHVIHARIPRSAPPIWNLGHREIRSVFHDGRLQVGDAWGNGFDSPAQDFLPEGLNSILAVQALFPVTSHHEMAGNPGENEVADAVLKRIDGAWPILSQRVRAIPEYAEMFIDAFAHVERAEDITIVEIANALAAFEGTEWANYDSDFDHFLAGDPEALNTAEQRGMALFYGEAGCAGCHSGPLLTDQEFHALALPPVGPGKAQPFDPLPRDVGRMLKTGDLADLYKFRTPSLRNVALTAPYGHNGSMPTLEAMVRHHLDPEASLASWTKDMAGLPDVPWLRQADFVLLDDPREIRRQLARVDVEPLALDEQDVEDIVAFLHCLTGRSALERPLGRPERVPSGLPVD